VAGGWWLARLLGAALQSCDACLVFVETFGLTGNTVREDPKIVAEALCNYLEVSPGFFEVPTHLFGLPPHLFGLPPELLVDLGEPPVDFRKLPTISLVGPSRCYSDAPNLHFHRLEATIHQSLELGNRHWLF
jgi:hypothetical protein